MKKTVILCFMILSLTLFSNAAIRVGLFGGFASTSEANYRNGVAFGGHLGFDLTPNIAVELRATRFSFDVTGSDTGLSKGKMAVMPLELNFQGRFPVGKSLIPYIVLGGGYSLNSFDVDAALLSDWDAVGMTIEETVKSGLAVFAGLGLDLAIMPGTNPGQGLFINLEARYMKSRTSGSWVLTDQISKTSRGADLEDLKLNSIMFGLGFKYGF